MNLLLRPQFIQILGNTVMKIEIECLNTPDFDISVGYQTDINLILYVFIYIYIISDLHSFHMKQTIYYYHQNF